MIGQINKEYIQTRRWKLWARFMAYFFFEGRPITTKGQWFNPIVFFGFFFWKRLPALRKVDQPIYIIGTGRSGTTILGIVMSMHRKVGFLNEPKALWHTVVPDEDVIGNYTLKDPVYYRLGADHAQPHQSKRLRRLYGAYAFFSGSKRVVDKYPEMAFRVPLIQALMPNAKFIFLTRNGWNTIHSIDRWSDKHGTEQGQEQHDWWGVNDRKWKLMVEQLAAQHPAFSQHVSALMTTTDHTHRAAVEWVLTMQEGLRLHDQMSADDLLFLPYETLTEDVTKAFGEIERFCELPHDPTFHAYGQQVLRPNTAKEPIELPAFIQQPFDDTMRRLGYA